ncbi:MAG: hypothetical protein AB1742_13865 [bacterium]
MELLPCLLSPFAYICTLTLRRKIPSEKAEYLEKVLDAALDHFLAQGEFIHPVNGDVLQDKQGRARLAFGGDDDAGSEKYIAPGLENPTTRVGFVRSEQSADGQGHRTFFRCPETRGNGKKGSLGHGN